MVRQLNRDLVSQVSNPIISEYNRNSKFKIIVFDCGIKNNIIRKFLNYKDIYLKGDVPYNYKIYRKYKLFDGIDISNKKVILKIVIKKIQYFKAATETIKNANFLIFV